MLAAGLLPLALAVLCFSSLLLHAFMSVYLLYLCATNAPRDYTGLRSQRHSVSCLCPERLACPRGLVVREDSQFSSIVPFRVVAVLPSFSCYSSFTGFDATPP